MAFAQQFASIATTSLGDDLSRGRDGVPPPSAAGGGTPDLPNSLGLATGCANKLTVNDIIEKVFVNGQPIIDVELKELIGHTKVEVAGGFIVGVLTALAFILL